MAADQAPADDWLWNGLAEGLRKFHFIYRALCRKDLHHIMQITELPAQALFGQGPALNPVPQQIKKNVGSFFVIVTPSAKQT